MTTKRSVLLLAAAISLTGPLARAYEPTAAEKREMTELFEARQGQVPRMESDADALVAEGKLAEAMRGYQRTLGTFAVIGSYWTNFMHGAEKVSGGWAVGGLRQDKPAYRAGLRDGEVVTAVDGTSVADVSRMRLADLASYDVFEPLKLTVLRNGSPTDVLLTGPIYMSADLGDADKRRFKSIRDKMAALCVRAPRQWPVSKEGRELAVKAQALAKTAHSTDELKDAADHFLAATIMTPCWADLFLNYGLFQEASGDPIGARESFGYYQQLNPNATDMAAVKAKVADLAAKAEDQQRLIDWEGWWAQIQGGRPTDSGLRVDRAGNILTITNLKFDKPWLRATVTDDNTAQAYVRFSEDSSSMTPAFRDAIRKCFNGAMELATTMHLSPDRKRLTLESYNDIDIDVSNCHIVNQRTSALIYQKGSLDDVKK